MLRRRRRWPRRALPVARWRCRAIVLLWGCLPGHLLWRRPLPLLHKRWLLRLLVLLHGLLLLRLLLVGRLHGRLLVLLLKHRLHGRRHVLLLWRLRLELLQAGDVWYPEPQGTASGGHQHLARGELRGVLGMDGVWGAGSVRRMHRYAHAELRSLGRQPSMWAQQASKHVPPLSRAQSSGTGAP